MGNEKNKIGLFLCRCGTNIADFVHLDQLSDWANTKSDITFVHTINLMCSPQGKEEMSEVIKKQKVDYVVVAACSPKLHEKTFQVVVSECGYNMANVHMANIREHVGWVTADKDEATEKAKALIHAAILRTQFHESLERKEMECNTDVVVIGGGMAGIEAALLAANAGRKVTVIEKEISLGGHTIKTEEVAPNMECAPCMLAPRLSEIRDHENIQVISNAKLDEVVGFFGNFTVKATEKARYITNDCIGCEACFEPCPVSVDHCFHAHLGKRKAVYTLFPGSVPAMAVIDKKNCKQFIDGSCDACVSACPFNAINFKDEDKVHEIKAGSIILATGFKPFKPTEFPNLGYGTIENVYTNAEFDRLASSNGPTGGKIQLKNGSAPQSIAVIHCAGSLSEKGLPYCSGTCCMNATKVGELARKQDPTIQVTNVHNRLVFDSPTKQKFHDHQVKEGTQFVKTTDIEAVQIKPSTGGLFQKGAPGKICVSAPGMKDLVVDMVVLATGMKASSSNKEMAELLQVDIDQFGFFKSDHNILNETSSTLEGVYVAGSALSPCDVATSISRAKSATGSALSRLVPGRKIELEIMTACIDEDLCGGCKLCISVCPYKAVSYDEEKKQSIVNEAICRGCGTCVANCPSGAAKAKHFTKDQIYAEIEGVLHV